MIEEKAKELAKKAHEGQSFSGLDFYGTHLATAAGYLRGAGADEETIAAGWLHDALEDTNLSEAELEKETSTRVLSLVKEVTDDKSKPRAEQIKAQIEKAPNLSKEAKLIKLADQAASLTHTWELDDRNTWSKKLIQNYLAKTAAVVTALGETDEHLLALFWNLHGLLIQKYGTGEVTEAP